MDVAVKPRHRLSNCYVDARTGAQGLKSMKKLICILFSLTVLVASSFADKNRFYENGKVVDTMYVDSAEGLRVRDNPSLKSNRLCGLPHRLSVKVVAIGREETIDGITAPWVEILIPRYEWHGYNQEYGWVFGGYLSNKNPEFLPKQWTENDYRNFLSKCNWIEDSDSSHREILCFEESGDFKRHIEEMGAGGFGIWKPDFKNKSVTVKSKFVMAGDDDIEPAYNTETFKIENIEEFSISINGQRYISDCRYGVLDNEENFKDFDKTSSQFNTSIRGFMFVFYSSESIFDSIYRERASWLKDSFIRFGVYNSLNEDYMKSYNDYWNPIMEQHQKKADEMK